MWLINTTTLHLEGFQECPAKSYAILSHMWGSGAEELDFDEFKAGGGRGKVGFEKIRLCCEEAKKNDIQYVWVDTCCIDKRSSTELSETINSMFAWYAKSKICYVYLADVIVDGLVDHLTPGCHRKFLKQSRWFTRGWTLQELIAPDALTFFTKDWAEIGNKASLAYDISAITRIDIDVLRLHKSYLDCSIASRMSWASFRNTIRVEDNAYCLLGLFDVNLPLMYGEGGPKAFLRLQRQIIQQTDDETIFAWHDVPSDGSGILAPSAAHFARAGAVENQRSGTNYRERAHYFITNKGLSFECQLIPYAINVYQVPLNCCAGYKQESIFITRSLKDNKYRRIPYEEDSNYMRTRSLIRPRTCRITIPDDGHGLKLAPQRGLPLVRVRSHLETCHLDRRDPVAFKESYSGDYSTNCSLDEEYEAKQDLTLDMHTKPYRIQFRREQLYRGVIIAFKQSRKQAYADYDTSWLFNVVGGRQAGCCAPAILNDSDVHGSYLRFGFDEEFRPICLLYINHKSIPHRNHDMRDYESFYHDKRESPHAKARGDRYTCDNPRSIILNLPVNLCEYIEVSVRPLVGLKFELTISEKRRHEPDPEHWESRLGFCLECLTSRFVDSMAGAIFEIYKVVLLPALKRDIYFSYIIFFLLLFAVQHLILALEEIIRWHRFKRSGYFFLIAALIYPFLKRAVQTFYWHTFPEWSARPYKFADFLNDP